MGQESTAATKDLMGLFNILKALTMDEGLKILSLKTEIEAAVVDRAVEHVIDIFVKSDVGKIRKIRDNGKLLRSFFGKLNDELYNCMFPAGTEEEESIWTRASTLRVHRADNKIKKHVMMKAIIRALRDLEK